MRALIGGLAGAFSFWIAAVLQASVSPRFDLFGGHPDFLLTMALCWAAVSRPSGGAVAGFTAGFLAGSLAGVTTTLYVISRTVACFFLSWIGQTGIENSARSTVILVFLGTLACQIPFLLTMPHDFLGQIRATILSALVNGVLAIPLYGLLRRAFRPEVD